MKYDNFVRLDLLSPVHIGCGDTSDPLDYVITQKEGRTDFCQIDLNAWLEDYTEQDELSKVLEGKLQVIRKYIYDHLDPEIYARTRSQVLSSEITKKYLQHLNNTSSENQLLIDPALKNPLTGGLIIPGSSIKGAIRTAVLDSLDQQSSRKLKDTNYNAGIKELTGDISNNMFKQLKIGDFEALNGQSAIVTAKEVSRNPNKVGGTPKNSCETTLSAVMDSESSAIFGQLSIGAQHRVSDTTLTCPIGRTRTSWTLTELMALVTKHYRQRFEKEVRTFYSQPQFGKSSQTVQFLDKQFQDLQPHQMILRVGHYSHIECMTISANKPQTRKGIFGTTRTLADGAFPFGWVKLSLCAKEDYANYLQQKQQSDTVQAERRQQLRAAKIAQRQVQLQTQLEHDRIKEQIQQQRLLREQDEQKNPWKKIIRQVEQLKTWGDLKQKILENVEFNDFRHIDEFTQAIYNQAIEVRKTIGKWDDERDSQLVKWFEPTAQTWHVSQAQVITVVQLDAKQEAQREQIKAFHDLGEYKNANFNCAELEPFLLQCLQEKLKDWGCDNKKAKKDKKAIWDQVVRQLEHLKN